MRLLLVGHGRMGRLVESLAPEYSAEIAGWLDSHNNPQGAAIQPGQWPGVDVAIDFSSAAAVLDNVPRLASSGINLVIGTTGWQAHHDDLRRIAAEAGIGVVAAANFSLGVNLFEAIIERAAQLLANRPEYGAWIHELHHAAKRDAPSGTALALVAAMERAGYPRAISVSSTRAGFIPGTHTVGFDGPAETLTFTHATRDRATFARGALEAARWLQGRRGWFTMRDVLGLTPPATRGGLS